MSVYVDRALIRHGRMKMSHLCSPDLPELHEMAQRVGLKRVWFQDPSVLSNVSWPHYDISMTKRKLAVEAGAIEVDRYKFVAIANHIKIAHVGSKLDPLRHFRGKDTFSYYHDWLLEQTGVSYLLPPFK